MAPARDPFHDRLLALTLALPGAYEDRPWGSVHCKVDGKIFVGWSRTDDGDMSVGLRVDRVLQPMLVASDPRFTIAKYVGQYGGVDMRLGPRPDWAEVEALIVGSYRLVAPKRRVKELDARRAAPAASPAPKAARAKPPEKGATPAPKAARAPRPAAKRATPSAPKRGAKTAPKRAAPTTRR